MNINAPIWDGRPLDVLPPVFRIGIVAARVRHNYVERCLQAARCNYRRQQPEGVYLQADTYANARLLCEAVESLNVPVLSIGWSRW